MNKADEALHTSKTDATGLHYIWLQIAVTRLLDIASADGKYATRRNFVFAPITPVINIAYDITIDIPPYSRYGQNVIVDI